ncbi:MAG TPA: tetratricopeptide repeat protein, partial [Kofleriaceae bacterium]|nr:tetratricopeptide repeat protein [Kofleriaceae bacterium]
DRYAGGWVAAYTDACEATHARGEQSAALLDRRMACLARRRGELDALVTLLASGGADAAEHAVSAVYGLRPVASCGAAAVGQVAPPAADQRAAVAEVERELARADALDLAGSPREALAVSRAATERAAAIGYPPLAARAAYQTGFLELLTGDLDRGRARLREAVAAAQAAGDDDTAGQAAAALLYAAAERADADDGQAWAAFARASAARRGGDPLLVAKVHQYEGNLWRRRGDSPRAIGAYRAALAALEPALGPEHPGIVSALVGLGAALRATGDVAEARAVYQRAADMARALAGPDHPMVGFPLGGLGNALVAAGELERAAEVQAEVLRIWTAAFGERHPRVASALGNAAVLDLRRGQAGRALAGFERVLAIQLGTLGEDHPKTALTRGHIGEALLALGRRREARASLESAAAVQERVLGPDHPDLGGTLSALGRLRCAAGDRAAGEELLRRALAIGEARQHAGLTQAARAGLDGCRPRRRR